MPFQFLSGTGSGLSLVPGATGIRVIQPGLYSGGTLATFQRAQVGGVTALALNSDGTTWAEYGADAMRFHTADQGFLVEAGRTNNVRNPRPNFGTSPPTIIRPTNWTNTNGNGFSNTTFVSTQTINGIPTARMQVNDTASGAIWSQAFDTITAIAAVAGDVVFGRVHVRLESASAAPLTYFIRLVPRDASSVTLSGGIITQTYTPTGTLTAVTVSGTMPASTAYVLLEWGCTTTAAASYNFVQDFGAPTLEIEPNFLSTPILNPAGTSNVANVRGADLLFGAASGLFPSRVGAIRAKVVLPQNAPTGFDQTIFQIDDGTQTNRIRLRNSAGTANILMGKVVASASTNATSLGTHTAGTAFKVGMSWDGTDLSANLNGGTTQTIAYPSSELDDVSTFRIGSATNGNALNGRIIYFDAVPYAVPDLVTFTTGLP